MRVDERVICGVIFGWSHPMVETVDGDDCGWTGVFAGRGEFFEEVLPGFVGEGGICSAQAGEVE